MRQPCRAAIPLVVLAVTACKDVAAPSPAGPATPVPAYRLGDGWRAEIDRDPAVIERQGTGAWVQFWQNDLPAAAAAFRSVADPDEAAAGTARAALAVAAMLRLAHHAELPLEIEAASYRANAGDRIQRGEHTSRILAWALERSGRAPAGAGIVPVAAPPAPLRADDIEALVRAVPPFAVEVVREGGNEAELRHRDIDALLRASLGACQLALVAVSGRGEAFDPIRCEAAWCAGDRETASLVCPRAAAAPGPLPWWVVRFGVGETADDVRLLARARAEAAAGRSVLPLALEAGAMSAFVLAAAPESIPPGDRQRAIELAVARLAEVRAHVEQMRAAWTGPGAPELGRMQAAERQGAAVAAAVTYVLLALGEKAHMAVQGLESVLAQGRAVLVDARHSPEYLVAAAAAYLDANRFPEGIGVLRALEATYPVLENLREVAEVVSIQRALDTRGTARRD